MTDISFREILGEAIRYWERGRLLYNIVLISEVAIYFFLALPALKSILLTNPLSYNLNLFLTVFVLAVLANVAYCFAYIVDVFAQLSSLRALWLRYRWALFVVGLAFAVAITRFISLALFSADALVG